MRRGHEGVEETAKRSLVPSVCQVPRDIPGARHLWSHRPSQPLGREVPSEVRHPHGSPNVSDSLKPQTQGWEGLLCEPREEVCFLMWA